MTLSARQLETRRTRVGASEIAALIPPMADGTVVDHHGRGPFDIFAAKMGVKRPQSPEMRWGQIVESAILEMHCEGQGLTLLPNPGTLVHPRYPWICATPDAIARDQQGKRRLIEAKNSGRFMAHLWGAEGTGQVPIGYAAQVQVTLSTLLELNMIDSPEADICASIGGMPPTPFLIDFRPAVFERMAELARVFVEQHLLTGTPPEQGWEREAAEAYLRIKYPTSREPLLEASTEDVRLARQISYAAARVKKWERVEAEGKNRLRARIGPHEGIAGIATNKARADGTRVLRLAKGRAA